MMERTFVLIKTEGVQRGIVGEVLQRFEKTGLRIAATRLIWPTEEIAKEHYPGDEKWMTEVGRKSIESYKKQGKEITEEPMDIGKRIKKGLIEYLLSGPVLAIIFEGNHAVELVRKIVGPTEPRQAPPGTIRGDFKKDSYMIAAKMERPLRNIVHASSEVSEAEREIRIWFSESEIIDYDRADTLVLMGGDYKKH